MFLDLSQAFQLRLFLSIEETVFLIEFNKKHFLLVYELDIHMLQKLNTFLKFDFLAFELFIQFSLLPITLIVCL
jgi:hypothetical protein